MCSVEAEGQDHRSYSLLENHLHVLSHPNIRTCSLNNLSSWIFFSPVCIRCTFLYLLTTFFLYRSYPDGDLKPQCNVSWLCCPFSMEQHPHIKSCKKKSKNLLWLIEGESSTGASPVHAYIYMHVIFPLFSCVQFSPLPDDCSFFLSHSQWWNVWSVAQNIQCSTEVVCSLLFDPYPQE